MRSILAVLFMVAGVGLAPAASPQLTSILPKGGQRGTEVSVTLTGSRLSDAQEILSYSRGFTFGKLEVLGPTAIKTTMKIAPDVPLGEHAFRVRTATGVSDLRTFWVGALPVMDEKEGNNQFDTPMVVPMNVTIHGVVRSEQVDHYQVECKKGQRISVEIEGMRLGHTLFDPYVAILDSRRFELATSDDSALTGQDGGCSIVAPADGKYTIQVRETAFQGNDSSLYRLHIGHFPRPTGVIPAGGKPGEEIEFRFVGDPMGEIKQKIKLPPAETLHYRLHCATAEGVSPTGFKVRVTELQNTVESGTNTTPQTATAGVAPGAFHGVISKADETDYFKFTAKKGQSFVLRAYARQIGSPLDPVLHVGVLNGAYILGNDDTQGPDSLIRFTAPQDGEFALWIHDHLKKGGPDYFYRIEATPVQPECTVSVPKVDGNNQSNQDRQAFSVPRGGRFATLVRVGRRDWNAPHTLAFGQLPPGVTAKIDPSVTGVDFFPIVLEAAADAPLGAVLTDFRVTPTDGKTTVQARTRFDTVFSIGVNNTPFARHEPGRTAVAVTEAIPFEVNVIEPKVPIVQNGSYTLKVVATRKAGFTAPITVAPLFTPPGMGIVGSAQIPANSNETTLYVNAAPNAQIREWKTVLTAVSNVGNGPVWTCSQPFKLEVSAPMVTFAQERAAVEQGQKTAVVCKVNVNTPFEGKAKVNLMGLPAKTTTTPLELTKDTKELAFEVVTDKTSPAGKHNVFCQVVGGELRIDVPLPPKANPPATAPAAPGKATPAPAATPEKRLSRLEQLRKEQEEKEKAEKKGG
jgi:hypothetical protein